MILRARSKACILAICAVVSLSVANTVRATSIPLGLNASLTTGSLAGTNFTVSFSYDDSALTGTGQEYVSLLSFDFTLQGAQFTRADIEQGGQAVFLNGALQYVTAAYFPPPPSNSQVSDIAFGFGGPGVIGYLDLNRQFGLGSYVLTSAVPEPSSFLSLLLGLVTLLLIRLWRPPAA